MTGNSVHESMFLLPPFPRYQISGEGSGREGNGGKQKEESGKNWCTVEFIYTTKTGDSRPRTT